jgi:hypothetical protein
MMIERDEEMSFVLAARRNACRTASPKLIGQRDLRSLLRYHSDDGERAST